MRDGYYSDKYFVRAREVLLADKHRPTVTMQVFGKARAFLGGVDEAIAILKLCSERWDELEVSALYDGDEIEPWETVLLIEGPYDAGLRRLQRREDPRVRGTGRAGGHVRRRLEPVPGPI
jgi:nicotinic acid phosphoribosyltransferase